MFIRSLWSISFVITIYLFGVAWGGMLYFSVRHAFQYLLEHFLKVEFMCNADELFFHEDERLCANIIAFERVQRFNAKEYSAVQVERILKFKRMRCRVRKLLGQLVF